MRFNYSLRNGEGLLYSLKEKYFGTGGSSIQLHLYLFERPGQYLNKTRIRFN